MTQFLYENSSLTHLQSPTTFIDSWAKEILFQVCYNFWLAIKKLSVISQPTSSLSVCLFYIISLLQYQLLLITDNMIYTRSLGDIKPKPWKEYTISNSCISRGVKK